MDKLELRMAQAKIKGDFNRWKGLLFLEKCIGYQIDWLHSKPEEEISIESDKKYAVIDVKTEEIVLETNAMANIAKEFFSNVPKVSKCFKSGKLLDDRYMVVRCKHE